ncbi:MAG: hypothetical protein QF806_06395, partial [Pseudomonadales bacterium]|nr:hypothetical protein [Pseudomonadales bacterium]
MGIHKQYFFLSFCLWSFCAHSAEVTLANGDRYEGEVVDGALNGSVTYIWAGGDRYEGEFLNDQPDGSGTYRWVDGRIYTGEFQ